MTQEQIDRVFADAYARRAMHVINIVTPRKPPHGRAGADGVRT